jgi:hypothetical protein
VRYDGCRPDRHDHAHEVQKLTDHNPSTNGLKYLQAFSPRDATKMMRDPSWTRAIFLREPKQRFLSAYLDKVYAFLACVVFGYFMGAHYVFAFPWYA